MENQKITIQTLAQRVTWEAVKRALQYNYPEDKSNYQRVFNYLKTVKRRTQNDGEELQIHVVHEDSFSESYYHISTNKYSMSFRPWNKVANIPIAKETLFHHKYEDIVAHFIWEVTFYGTEPQMNKLAKDLKKRVTELKKSLKKKHDK